MKKTYGTKTFFIVFFLGLTVYYLWPTAQLWLENRHMDSLPEEERITYQDANIAKHDRLRNRALTMGLDLQGGMHVTMELQTHQLIQELARDTADDEFNDVLNSALASARANNSNIINEFINEFERRDSDARLSRYFRSDADNITRRSTNDEIRSWLQQQQDAAVERAIQIVRNRVDRFGVSEPSIMRQGANRLIVELPGVTDEERVRNLLKGAARLEFRLTPDDNDLIAALQRIIDYYESDEEPEEPEVGEDDFLEVDRQTTTNKLLEVFIPQGRGPEFGLAAARDTASVRKLLGTDAVRRMLPGNTDLLWTASPRYSVDGRDLFVLIAVRGNYELTGEVITDARPDFDPETNRPQVSMTMNRQGARVWSRVTGANINRPIAIVLDNAVYSYPNVITKITGGRSSITGLESLTEAQDLVNILLSGALPAPLDIVEERTVGPSLGEASIRAGFTSALAGLFLVALFMIFYYRQGGVIADLTLFLNIVFIMGILSAFSATLTLPGIAGIVLTIGMAVDANVLIFDRIREEQRAGKSLIAAIDSGYSNALSAILDANITTFLTATILFSFGVGPIKGFAITLMAGIAASLFCALVISRVIVDYLSLQKSVNVNFG